MRNNWLCTTAIVLLVTGGLGFAAAQTVQSPPAGENPAETGTEPQKPAEQNPSATQQGAQVAPTEPKEVHIPQSGPAFIDGALAAPGADKDSQTVPAKFSAKNDAEDHLPIPAFAFKHLSDEQKRVIVESVKDAKTAPPKGTAPAEAYAKVSMKLPSSADLRALPDSVLAQMPEMEGYSYATVGNKVLLVRYHTVVAVLGE